MWRKRYSQRNSWNVVSHERKCIEREILMNENENLQRAKGAYKLSTVLSENIWHQHIP